MADERAGAVRRRVIYWGGKSLGHRCFVRLAEHVRSDPGVEIAAVWISERGARKGDATESAIAEAANTLGIPVFTERDDVAVLADVGLAVGYPHVIPDRALRRCRDGALNLHMGPLPHYRGSKTLEHAILNGERRYGVSLHYMDAALDTGDVVAVRWMDLPEDQTAERIMRSLGDLGFDLVADYLPRILRRGKLPATAQAQLAADAGVLPRCYTRASIMPLYRLSATWEFATLYRHVRALTAGDGRLPYLECQGRRIYLSIEPSALRSDP